MLEIHTKLPNRAGLFEEKKLPQNEPKQGFLNLLKNLVIIFFLNLVYNESLYYLLYSCTNSIFGKYLVPEICVEMLLASHIAGFLNRLYL